jgi:Flp pilus assembly protein TadD
MNISDAINYFNNNDLDRAETISVRLIEADPVRNFIAFYILGVINIRRQKFADASRLISKFIAGQPNHADAYIHWAIALKCTGQIDAAINAYACALALRPEHQDAYFEIGSLAAQTGNFAAAVDTFRYSVWIKPDWPDALANLGSALVAQNNLPEGVRYLSAALQLAPNFELACHNLSSAKYKQGAYEHSAKYGAQALCLSPHDPECYQALGAALYKLTLLSSSIRSFRRAQGINPDFHTAKLAESISLLLSGDLRAGFAKYESRWLAPPLAGKVEKFDAPLWRGDDDLSGKVLLVLTEQGFGDTLQFCRFIPPVIEMGAQVIFEVRPEMRTLLSNGNRFGQIIEVGEARPHFDYYCPLMSLPVALKTDLNSIPAPQSYLSVTRELIEIWKQKIGPVRNPRIGVVWSGEQGHINDANRSIPLELFSEIFDPKFSYYCLQKIVRPADAQILGQFQNLAFFGDELTNFEDTAALVSLMDIIVSVDTSVAHLAGALGKRTIVLLPHCPDWRWLLETDESPWYPTLKLSRQNADRRWMRVLKKVAEELRQFTG